MCVHQERSYLHYSLDPLKELIPYSQDHILVKSLPTDQIYLLENLVVYTMYLLIEIYYRVNLVQCNPSQDHLGISLSYLRMICCHEHIEPHLHQTFFDLYELH